MVDETFVVCNIAVFRSLDTDGSKKCELDPPGRRPLFAPITNDRPSARHGTPAISDHKAE